MIPVASGVRVWIATGHTDMRRGMNTLALLVQEALKRDPHGGDLYVFRGKNGKLIKILWHDGLGMSLYAKRLERGRFVWPQASDGAVTITPAQLGLGAGEFGARLDQRSLQRILVVPELFGPRSERSQRLLDQLELQLEELAAAAGEDAAARETTGIPAQGFTRPKTRRNFPAHLPRRRIVHPAPACCPCCGGTKLSKIGEDVTETLDVVPRQLFVTEHVREKFSCRYCEKISQPPAPFHAISRGFAGPSLLAMILADKYANHQPLNRQSEQLAREGVELSVSTMADHFGACAAALLPLAELIKAHVFAAERIHGDDTTVPVLAKVKTKTGRLVEGPLCYRGRERKFHRSR